MQDQFLLSSCSFVHRLLVPAGSVPAEQVLLWSQIPCSCWINLKLSSSCSVFSVSLDCEFTRFRGQINGQLISGFTGDCFAKPVRGGSQKFPQDCPGGNEEKLLRSTVYFLFLVLLLGYWYLRTNIMQSCCCSVSENQDRYNHQYTTVTNKRYCRMYIDAPLGLEYSMINPPGLAT